MQVHAIKIAHWRPSRPGDIAHGLQELMALIPALQDGMVVAVASKMFSLLAGCRLPKAQTQDQWQELLRRESDEGVCWPPPEVDGGYALTLKMGRLLANAGIDQSNTGSENASDYLLLPPNLQNLAEQLWALLRSRDRLARLGLIVTDSGILPLRRGVIGVALAWCGIKPLFDYHGQNDLDGRELRCTAINVIDSLATSATLVMGEGAESTPIALIVVDDGHVNFADCAPTAHDLAQAQIAFAEDLYSAAIDFKTAQRKAGGD